MRLLCLSAFMVLQEMIRYEPDAVGLKPSAKGSEAHLLGMRLHSGSRCITLLGRPLQIQRQQLCQDRLVAQIMRLAIGVTDSLVEFRVRLVKPGRALVAELGERALLELGLAQARLVQPGLALRDEPLRSRADRGNAGIITHRRARFKHQRPIPILARRLVADQAAEIKKVLLTHTALFARIARPLRNELVWGEAGSHAYPSALCCFRVRMRHGHGDVKGTSTIDRVLEDKSYDPRRMLIMQQG